MEDLHAVGPGRCARLLHGRRAQLRDKHGYPEITPALRAKIFGLNALKIYPVAADVVKQHVKQDKVAVDRQEYRGRPDPAFVTYGPKTRREFFGLKSRGA